MSRARYTVFLALAALISVLTSRAAVSVKTQLDRDSVMVGETASLTISVEGGTPQSVENFKPSPGLTIQYQGTSQNMTIINGATSSKRILSFAIQASQPGQFEIPSVRVTVDGAPYSTEPLRLTVTKSDIPGGNRNAFLKLNVPKQQVYVGEMIPIEIQLYVATRAENAQAPQLKSDGFVVHKQAEATRSQTQIGNLNYTVLSFKWSISAAKAGQLSLGPAEQNLALQIRTQPDPNDLFGMFRQQLRPVTLTSPSVEMTVLPLPANAPPDFSGAIGKFNWQVSAGPTSVAAGDPITLKIIVNGRGNLDNLKLPDLNWPDFKAYPPTTTVTPQDQLGLSGTKTFEQVIVPQSATLREIPALSLAYFDPETKQYAHLTQAAVPLTVRPSAGGPVVPTVVAGKNSEPDEPQNRTDIVHIKADPGPLVAFAPPLVRQPWFLIVQALPVLGFVGVSLWRRRQDQLANNPRLRRKIEAQRIVSAGLAQLPPLVASNKSDELFALVFRLLQEQLGERLGLPASAITEAVLDERLPKRGASPELIHRLHGLFQICNQARYAPVRSNEELQAVASNLEKALGELQQLPD
jgi:hypothetical protein